MYCTYRDADWEGQPYSPAAGWVGGCWALAPAPSSQCSPQQKCIYTNFFGPHSSTADITLPFSVYSYSLVRTLNIERSIAEWGT